MKQANKLKLFILIACATFALLFACENPWMAAVLQEKTIYFDSNGGSLVPSQKLFVGERAVRPANPVLQGWVFGGWYIDNWTFEEPYDFNFIPTYSMTLYAKWIESESNIVDIYISAPVANEIPNTSAKISSTRYTCSQVTWWIKREILSGNFKGGTQYTATVTLTANGSYTFTTEIIARVNGNIAEIIEQSAISITLSYEFPETEALFNDTEDLRTYLERQDSNTADNPCTVKLNVSDTEFPYCTLDSSITEIIKEAKKFVNLELTGNTLTTIGGSAFYGCEYLTGITIPNSVTSIEQFAFYQCSALTNVTIPNGVTTIKDYTFSYCASLTSIIIPNSVIQIGEKEQAFEHCTSLTSVTFERADTDISYAFFPGNLYDVYGANPGGGAGTYTRSTTGTDPNTWTKQP